MLQSAGTTSPRIYHLPHRYVGSSNDFPPHLDRCRALGFDHLLLTPPFWSGELGNVYLTADHDRLDPSLATDEGADDFLSRLAGACEARGLRLLLDIALDEFSADHPFVADNPDGFALRRLDHPGPIDPRQAVHPQLARARFSDPHCRDALLAWWERRLLRLLHAGVAGFRFLRPERIPADGWRSLFAAIARPGDAFLRIGTAHGADHATLVALAQAGFDGFVTSLPWWDFKSPWLVEEYAALSPYASPIAAPELLTGPRLAASSRGRNDLCFTYGRALRLAAVTGCGVMIPAGCEYAVAAAYDPASDGPQTLQRAAQSPAADVAAEIAFANRLLAEEPVLRACGELRTLTEQGAPVTALLRADATDVRIAQNALLILVNPDGEHDASIAERSFAPSLGNAFDCLGTIAADGTLTPVESDIRLRPGEVRLLRLQRAKPIVLKRRLGRRGALAAAGAPRLVITGVSPRVRNGAFAAKRVIGETVRVEADVICDGHDVLGVELQWRTAADEAWHRERMNALGNDRWAGNFPLRRMGRYEYAIEAWIDRFATFARDIAKKLEARVDLAQDLAEGIAMAEAALARDPAVAGVLGDTLRQLAGASAEEQVARLLEPDVQAAMAQADERPFRTRTPQYRLDADRTAARFASWYELFPRSQTDEAGRHGTFDDVIARLPDVRAMGFDVLYLTPIHPIGKSNRKGRNNSLRAEPGDPGSPYAIGGEEGGHDAIHPQLGTIADFRRLRAAAYDHGLELALDFAIQCSPDHPWLREHPGWFAWRRDGTLRYAENPPKKYEDIVNVDFYAKDAVPDLWLALRDIVLYWITEGVRIFRVDNPHTKPLPFWQWLIAEVRASYPDAIFLSEAFTRPKMMYRLAQLGFTQSYTYFTWRTTKRELTDYLTELTTTEVKDYFRPHFFVNTPDINPYFLQTSGRAGFLARACLAATLSGLWGMYSGFELLESDPVPGREEYDHSEKYEIKPRDWHAPHSIAADIARLNRLRKAHPALQSHLGLTFYAAHNEQIIYYGKSTAERSEIVLVAVNLDPHAVQEADFEIPLWEWGLPDSGALDVEDLVADRRFVWRGKMQRMRLDPAESPYAIWRVQPHRG